jgi:hypothetical protein
MRHFQGPFTLVFLLGVVGCSLESASTGADVASNEDWPEAIDVEDVKLAEVTLSNGDKLGWYEVAPGVTMTGLKITAGHSPQTDYTKEDASTLSPAELFDKIVARVPQKVDRGARASLTAAHERTLVLAASMKGVKKSRNRGTEAESRSGSSAETGEVRETRQAAVNDSAFPWTQFKEQDACGSYWEWVVSWPHITGDSSFLRSDCHSANLGAASYRGTINYRVRVNVWSWETPVSVNLSAGHGWIWSDFDAFVDFDIEAKVTNASGDGYHHCGGGLY